MSVSFTVVVPTIGRPSLSALLGRLGGAEVVVVDDRNRRPGPLDLDGREVKVVETQGGKGPAATRNHGWRATASDWVVFLDDDVLPAADWLPALIADLDGCEPDVAGVQGRVDVPLPADRPPTDRERNVAGLAGARWITADMAYRRSVLEELGGFDEGFRRAYREDSDLALRVIDAGWRISQGERRVTHPVGPAPWWASVSAQRGNRDDVRMRRRHGVEWRTRAGAGRGMIRRHALTTGLAATALTAAIGGSNRLAALAGAAWAGLTGDFACRRIGPGPRTIGEVAAMLATSVAIPPAATWWWLSGVLATKTLRETRPLGHKNAVEAVLFDRDGTLVVDVPYNGSPEAVEPVPGAREAIDRLRHAGIRVGIVSNQSGIGRGLIDAEQTRAVMDRVDEVLGPFDVVVYCPHVEADGCDCRKPAPGMVVAAAQRLGVDPRRCVVVGDILADVTAGEAAGARAVLVPNEATAADEPGQATHVSPNLTHAVETVLAWRGA